MNNINVREKTDRICQGGIYKNIEHIEFIEVKDSEEFDLTIIKFPLVIVLTQDCDLEWDYQLRKRRHEVKEGEEKSNDDKQLLSVIVAPLYNAEHVYEGTHLNDIGLAMAQVPKPRKKSNSGKALIQNKNPRYHYLEFKEELQIVPSIIDFKHYFTVGVPYLLKVGESRFVCSIDKLYRERISQRFCNFLARIGLPDRE